MTVPPGAVESKRMLIDRIRDDMKTAMKARDAARVEVLRFLVSEVKNVGINEKRDLDDAVVMGVLQKLSKQRREGVEQFRAVGREDLAESEMRQLAVLEEYMPRQATDAEVEAEVRAAAAAVGAASRKDMGKVMKAALEKLRGRADGKRVQAAVEKVLP